MKFLIVEDDLISLRILEKSLIKWGHEVFTAGNGLEAWEILQQKDPHIIISDWNMPIMDGITLCKKIRDAYSRSYVYFILLTFRESKNDILKGLDSGADDYLTKPFDPTELKIRLKRAERIISLERKLKQKNQELSILNQQLKELARVDALMKIGNRRGFVETVSKMHDSARRYGRCYGIIMFDIDNFKAYNDRYGHQAGDQILKQVAEALKKTIRKSDKAFRVGEGDEALRDKEIFSHNPEIFRFGGEEIVFLLPEQNLQGASIAAERIRKVIEGEQCEHKGNHPWGVVTVSCGVASCCSDNDRQQRWEDILERADQALYRAKQLGRNCVQSIRGGADSGQKITAPQTSPLAKVT